MSLKKIFKQSANYFWGEASIRAASLISFPIFTRLLTKEQYGLMALLAVTANLLGPVFSQGLDRSIVRYYHRFKKSGELTIFVGSLFNSSLLLQVMGLLITLAIAYFLLSAEIISFELFSLLPLALAVVILRNIFMLLNNLHRMDEEIFKYNVFSIIRQYSAMGASVIFVLIYSNLYSFYITQFATHALVVCVLVVQYHKKAVLLVKATISKPIIKESLKYGYPLAISAICSTVFNLGDRYVIAYFLDAENVASYSVSFNLCNIFKELVVTSINLSLIPLAYEMWEKGNVQEIKKILNSALKYYCMAVLPVLCIYMLIPKQLITFVASSKYIDAADVLPILMAGIILGFNTPFSLGLYLEQKTSVIMISILFMSLVNIGLNFCFVPIWGIQGAAFSTLICGIGLIFCFYLLSRKILPLSVPIMSIGKYAILSGGAYGIMLTWIPKLTFDTEIITILTISTMFFLLYVLSLLIFDTELRLNLTRKIKGYS